MCTSPTRFKSKSTKWKIFKSKSKDHNDYEFDYDYKSATPIFMLFMSGNARNFELERKGSIF